MDELAAAARRDPVEFRRALLAGAPRHLGVLNLAAEKAGWGTPLPAGHARGIAVHESFNTYVAEVAEVSVERGKPVVHRVVCAVDCGIAVNPDVIAMQMESAVAYGLSAALHGEITLKEGRVVQGNFDTYMPLRLNEMPVVEVHIVPSGEPPTGVGEPGTPPIAPAVANALFKLTGKPVRTLPIRL
jgi:isoquinoline 1-oxidoreductase beta subunit